MVVIRWRAQEIGDTSLYFYIFASGRMARPSVGGNKKTLIHNQRTSVVVESAVLGRVGRLEVAWALWKS